MKSKSVKNAIQQCSEYIKFMNEMENDPQTTEVMKKSFRQNLPRSKQQVKDSIERLVSNKDWLKIIKKENETEEIQREEKIRKV